jgi:hypothetical protein
MPIFERFTDAAKRAIYFARLEANHRDADCITPEYILAGLTWESDTCAGITSLKELTLTLRAHIELPHLPSTPFPYLRDRDIPLSADGKKTLAYAVEEANRDRQYWIDCDHLLRGLLSFHNGACDVLEQAGINLSSERSAAKLHSRKHPSTPAPKWGDLKLALDRNRLLLAWSPVLALILAIVVLLWLRGPV